MLLLISLRVSQEIQVSLSRLISHIILINFGKLLVA